MASGPKPRAPSPARARPAPRANAATRDEARQRLGTDERRAQLLAAGRALFTSRSYDEVSIDALAEAAGVSKGLLYHYFPTKRDFYVATLREAADALVVETQPPEELPPLERLWSGLDAYLRFAERHAPAYVGLLRGGIGSDPEVALVVEGTRRALAERVSSAVGASAGPALRLAVRGWVGYVEATSLEWLERPDVPRSELLSSWVALLAWLVPGHALADVAAG